MKQIYFLTAFLLLLTFTQVKQTASFTNPLTIPSTVNETLLCDICKISVDIVNIELKFTNSTVQLIGEVVEALCYLIGGNQIGDGCKQLVGDIDEIVNDLAKGMNSIQICNSLNFCYQADTSTTAAPPPTSSTEYSLLSSANSSSSTTI